MKRGKYFTIPENPADMDRLWKTGESLDRSKMPGWAEHAEPASYRHIGCAGWRGAEPPLEYQQELFELQNAGVIVDSGTADHPADHFYLSDPDQAWFNEAVWSIGIYSGKSPHQLVPAKRVINPVITRENITDIPAAFVADPFMIRVGDQWLMFFEVMNYLTCKGDIGLAISRDGLKWDYQQIVLTEPFHLSYPYVFEEDGQYFMIPESHQAGAVRLYVAEDFPLRWKLVTELIRAPYLADPSIFQHDKRWYLFADASTDLASDTLRLYHADHLTGPWIEHAISPVITFNKKTARPGGRVIHDDGTLIRYAQGCVPYYGTDVRAFEITELTETTYKEKEIAAVPILGPTGQGWNACGMHHVDANHHNGQWIAAVDGWRSETLLGHSKISLGKISLSKISLKEQS